MDNKHYKNQDRRGFLREGLRKGSKILAGAAPLIDTNEKVKMLTPDGKVVKVDKRYVKKIKSKTSNQEILDWMDNPGIKAKK